MPVVLDDRRIRTHGAKKRQRQRLVDQNAHHHSSIIDSVKLPAPSPAGFDAASQTRPTVATELRVWLAPLASRSSTREPVRWEVCLPEADHPASQEKDGLSSASRCMNWRVSCSKANHSTLTWLFGMSVVVWVERRVSCGMGESRHPHPSSAIMLATFVVREARGCLVDGEVASSR